MPFFFIALAASAALYAQSGESSPKQFRFGIGASGVRPVGEFGDVGGDGFGGSLMLEWEPNSKMALRGRVEYITFGKKDYWHQYGRTSASGLAAFVDYAFRFGSNDRGLYVFGGAGLMNCAYRTEWDSRNGGGVDTQNKARMALAIGGGYNLTRNFGLDAGFNVATGMPDKDMLYLPTDTTDYPPFNWMQVAARWRF
jgi:opacity protein-like surface antigen